MTLDRMYEKTSTNCFCIGPWKERSKKSFPNPLGYSTSSICAPGKCSSGLSENSINPTFLGNRCSLAPLQRFIFNANSSKDSESLSSYNRLSVFFRWALINTKLIDSTLAWVFTRSSKGVFAVSCNNSVSCSVLGIMLLERYRIL